MGRNDKVRSRTIGFGGSFPALFPSSEALRELLGHWATISSLGQPKLNSHHPYQIPYEISLFCLDIPTNLLGVLFELSATTFSQTNMKNANLKDDNANHSCLVGCFAHTSTQPDNRDPDILSYFLVRKTINAQGNESASVSPLYSSSRKRSLDSRSVERSPEPLKLSTESQKARRSEDSKRSRRRKRNSVSSSQSAPSKYQSIKDWSAGVDARTPPSFGSLVCNAIDPPRAAKPGFEWVWFPEGYWAEREIRGFMPPRDSMKLKWWNRSPDQKSRTPTKTMSGDKPTSGDKTPPPPSFIIPRIQIGSVSLKSTTKPSRRPSENETQKNNLWDFNFIKSIQREDSRSTQQREGLYYRTKRNIETRFRKRVQNSSI